MRKMIEICKTIIAAILAIIVFYAALVIGKAWEDQKRCENGATKFCISVDSEATND